MAFVANTFTATALSNAFIAQEEAFATPRIPELAQEIVAGAAILAHQDHRIVANGFGQACTSATVFGLRTAATTDKGNTTFACVPTTGTKAGSDSLTLTKSALVNVEKFSIDDVKCNNAVDFGRELGYMLALTKANLEVKLSKALVGMLNTNKDTPLTGWFETTNTVAANIVEIEKQYFTADVLADLQWAAKSTYMNMPLILNGRNFFNKAILDQYATSGCCTNDAILNRNQYFDIVWDAKNVDSVTSAASTFVMDKNALIFWSSPAYSNIGMNNMQEDAADVYHWVETLPRLQYFANGEFQPIYVDIRATRACVTDAAGIPRTGWHFELALYGALATNFEDAYGYQGIFRVDQVPNS